MKKRIMLGIYLLYLVRKLKNPFVRESLVFILLASTLLFSVSVTNVFANMLDSGNFSNYLLMAFSNTELVVKSVIILTGIVLGLFVRNITTHTVLKARQLI